MIGWLRGLYIYLSIHGYSWNIYIYIYIIYRWYIYLSTTNIQYLQVQTTQTQTQHHGYLIINPPKIPKPQSNYQTSPNKSYNRRQLFMFSSSRYLRVCMIFITVYLLCTYCFWWGISKMLSMYWVRCSA